MRGPIRSLLLGGLAVCAFAMLTVGQASAATLKENGGGAFLAIYGSPSLSEVAGKAIGSGLGRNFGFGENLLFQACTKCTTPVGTNLNIELEGGVVAEAGDSNMEGTLTSNKTGANVPLGLTIQFVDLQKSTLAGVVTPSYSDTNDRPWITEICAPASVTCKTDPLFTGPAGGVKIEDVSVDLGGTVVQGTLWGIWENGTAVAPPCIKLEKPPAGAGANQNLIVTQSSVVAVGTKVIKYSGKACLISANNNYWKLKAGEEKTPLVEIENT